ncbi:hypothetical protein C8J57DRAFT_1531456 [Mycena rebaudengoi]|nr:hypothetical protein C8J57DRAFT_1531456 [Mycena rebaudengoi]
MPRVKWAVLLVLLRLQFWCQSQDSLLGQILHQITGVQHFATSGQLKVRQNELLGEEACRVPLPPSRRIHSVKEVNDHNRQPLCTGPVNLLEVLLKHIIRVKREMPPDQNNTSLRHIDLTQDNAEMARSRRVFGDLGHLMAFQTEAWAELYKVLAQARDTPEDVQIHVRTYENSGA